MLPPEYGVKEPGKMPSVLVVPVYVEVPDGFERAVTALEAHLRRAGYAFYTGEPLPVTLEETKRTMLARQTAGTNGGYIGKGLSAGVVG